MAISLSPQQACPFVQGLLSLLGLVFQQGLAYLQGLAFLQGLASLQGRWRAAQLLEGRWL